MTTSSRTGGARVDVLAKARQAIGIWILVLFILAVVQPAALHLWQVWAVVIASSLANMLQPSYRAFEGSRTPEDRGTAAQILWTVYLTQGAALVELVWRRRLALPLDPTTWVALCAMIGGLGLRTWAVILLGPWFTWNVTVQSGQQLISHGPYRFIRHPSYMGALIAFVATCVLLRSWGAALLALIALALAFSRRIRYEEALLVEGLAGYDVYISRTGRLLPRIF
jgi:protein-S-isoprenylcysteine O-methyltransferase Ste14